MNNNDLAERITRVQELLRDIHHLPLATVNQDGSPHNSPVFAAFDEQYNFYWASHPDTEHSKNIRRLGLLFAVVFDSREGHVGLYIQAAAKECQAEADITKGYVVLQKLKKQFYGTLGPIEQYQPSGSQRIYKATPRKLWINKSDRDVAGVIIRDRRYEISLADLG